jgi:hypothetical protein
MGTWSEISLGKGYTQTYSPLWREMCGNVRSPLESQMHYHFCEFGVLRCCIILELGSKDQTLFKLDYTLIGLKIKYLKWDHILNLQIYNTHYDQLSGGLNPSRCTIQGKKEVACIRVLYFDPHHYQIVKMYKIFYRSISFTVTYLEPSTSSILCPCAPWWDMTSKGI